MRLVGAGQDVLDLGADGGRGDVVFEVVLLLLFPAAVGLGDGPLQLVEFLGQDANVLAVFDAERGEVRLQPDDLGGAFV